MTPTIAFLSVSLLSQVAVVCVRDLMAPTLLIKCVCAKVMLVLEMNQDYVLYNAAVCMHASFVMELSKGLSMWERIAGKDRVVP